MVKWIVGFTTLFFLGFWIGRTTAPVPVIPEANENGNAELIESLKAKIAELESARSAPKPSTEVVTQLEAPKEAHLQPLPSEKIEEDSPEPVSPPKKQWRAAEKNLRNVSNPQEVKNFLETTKIENFMLEMQNVQPFTASEEILEYLNGSFTGVMTSQSEVSGFNVALTANIRMEGQKLKGRTSIRLSRNGRAFSRGSSNGDIESIQRFKEKSLSVVVYSGDYYFQLYYVPSLETFEGNCYQQFKPGQMRYLGTVHLERI